MNYIKELENGNISVDTKDGLFELTDIPFEITENVTKRCAGQESRGLLSASIVAKDGEPKKFTEEDVGKLKSSTVLRLMQGVDALYGIEDTEKLFQNGGKE